MIIRNRIKIKLSTKNILILNLNPQKYMLAFNHINGIDTSHKNSIRFCYNITQFEFKKYTFYFPLKELGNFEMTLFPKSILG